MSTTVEITVPYRQIKTFDVILAWVTANCGGEVEPEMSGPDLPPPALPKPFASFSDVETYSSVLAKYVNDTVAAGSEHFRLDLQDDANAALFRLRWGGSIV